MQTGQLIDDLAQKVEAVKPAASPYQLFSRWVIYALIYIAVLLLFMNPRPDFAAKLHRVGALYFGNYVLITVGPLVENAARRCAQLG